MFKNLSHEIRPHSSFVPTPNTHRCLPRNYGYEIDREAISRKDLLALFVYFNHITDINVKKKSQNLKNFSHFSEISRN